MRNKHILNTIVLTIVAALLISCFGMLNQWHISMGSAKKLLASKAYYLMENISAGDALGDDYTSEELYERIEESKNNSVYLSDNGSKLLSDMVDGLDTDDSDADIYVYDVNEDKIIGDLSEKEKSDIIMMAKYGNLSSWPWGRSYFYVSDYDGSNKIIYRASVVNMKLGTASSFEAAVGISGISIALMILFLIIASVSGMGDKKIIKGLKIIGAVWISVATFVFFILNCSIVLINDYSNMNSVFEEIDTFAGSVSEMSDDEVMAAYDELCPEESSLREYVESKGCQDIREKLLYAKAYRLIDPEVYKDNFLSDITFNENVWDTSVPIMDRIDVEINTSYIVNEILSSVLFAIMFITLYVILLTMAPNEDRTSENVDEKPGTKSLEKIVFFKNIADSLMSVVAMAMFAGLLSNDFTDEASGIVKNITLTLAGLVSLIAVIAMPFLVSLFRTTKRFLVVTFLICISGCICCLNTLHAVTFAVGYIIISLAEALVVNVRFYHPIRESEDLKSGFIQSRLVSNNGRIGSLLGMVAGGVMGAFFPIRVSYFIAIVILTVCLIISLKFPNVEYKGQVDSYEDIKKVVFRKSIIPAFILVAVPYGFIDYTIKIIVPLNIADMGYTTTLVSFIMFLRQTCILFFKKENRIRALWKKNKTGFNVVVSMLSASAILICYYLIKNIYVMLIITVVLAFLRSGMDREIRNAMYEAAGPDCNYFGSSMIGVAYSQVSKTIAPLISGISVCLLPAIMALGTGAYAIRARRADKKLTGDPNGKAQK